MEIIDAYDYLIHLIACAIHREVPKSLPDGITYEQVLSCAIRHDVAGFAYLGVLKAQNKPNSETLERWKQRYFIGIQRNIEQEETLKILLDSLHSEGIATLEVQGTKVKRYYPSPDLRMMGDIDIIIKKENITMTEKILAELGYKTLNQENREINGYLGDKNIEIHSEFFSEGSSYGKIISDPFKNAVVQNDLNATVSDTVFWTYHLLHCLKHYRSSGVGFRRILDLYFLKNKMEKTADIEYVNNILSKNGFAEDIKDLFAIAEYWFDGKETDRDISEAVVAIKYAGTQGSISVHMNNKFKEKRFKKLRYFLYMLFPTKNKIYKSYSYCKEHRYPYVLCWLYRAVHISFKQGRIKTLIRYIKRINKADVKKK